LDGGIVSARHSTREDASGGRPRVVIAGGGVAALEALIALRELMDGFVAINLVAPSPEFVYRPLSVAEPFGLARPRHFALKQIAADHDAGLHGERVEAVEPGEQTVTLSGGAVLEYDALLLAPGARPQDWLPGATHFAGPEHVERVRAVVDQLCAGEIAHVVFTVPAAANWTLPLYELALLTAAHVAEIARGDFRLTIATPETDPLEAFGPAAAEHVRTLCVNRGIALRTRTRPVSFQDGELAIDGHESIKADHVVALPKLTAEPIEGVPHIDGGFIPVDGHCAVAGLARVYAAGDAIAYPVKQGGLAAQEADAAAERIAAELGAAIKPRPFRPSLRGQLLTGLAPTYLSAGPASRAHVDASVSMSPLWWPPSKIAARYLAPYLAGQVTFSGEPGQLEERSPVPPPAPEAALAEREELRELALTFAEDDAAKGEYISAVRWLDTIEQMDGVLSPALEDKRTAWRQRPATASA
jgi:sulfide:quinone oxidoreductase